MGEVPSTRSQRGREDRKWGPSWTKLEKRRAPCTDGVRGGRRGH